MLSKALDPVEKAQRQLALAQMSFQTQALQDYKSGKLSPGDFYMGPNGLPIRKTPLQKLEEEEKRQMIDIRQKTAQHSDLVQNSSFGPIYGAKIPTQGGGSLPAPDIPQDTTGANDYAGNQAPLPQRDALPSTLSGWGLQDPRSGLAPQIGF